MEVAVAERPRQSLHPNVHARPGPERISGQGRAAAERAGLKNRNKNANARGRRRVNFSTKNDLSARECEKEATTTVRALRA
jgi:hypothetical protein